MAAHSLFHNSQGLAKLIATLCYSGVNNTAHITGDRQHRQVSTT